jgi:chorismate mutase
MRVLLCLCKVLKVFFCGWHKLFCTSNFLDFVNLMVVQDMENVNDIMKNFRVMIKIFVNDLLNFPNFKTSGNS